MPCIGLGIGAGALAPMSHYSWETRRDRPACRIIAMAVASYYGLDSRTAGACPLFYLDQALWMGRIDFAKHSILNPV